MTLSGLGLLTMREFPCGDVSFYVSSLLKTILPALFRTFDISPRFLPSKPSFRHDHLPPNIRIFPLFLAVSIPDKPVNRSIHAYALT